MIAGERMSSRQLSSLDFDEEDNEVEGEIEVQELGRSFARGKNK